MRLIDADELQKQFDEKAQKAEALAKQQILAGNREAGCATLSSVTEECTELLYAFAKTESKHLAEIIKAAGGLYGRQKEAIEKYIAYAEIPLLEI